MEPWETVTMSRKEARRPGVVEAAVAGRITTGEGARALGLSRRQFRRLKARYSAAGVRGLVHRLRGRPSPRALAAPVRAQVVALATGRYEEFNDCHCTEYLRAMEGLAVSRSTVRRLRRAQGQPPKRRRRPRQHRARREPAARRGALVLIDGSPYDWLGTGTPCLLLGAIDDATSAVLALHFRPAEDLHGYLTLLHQLAARHGLPISLYGDRLNVFVRTDDHWSLEEELAGAQHPTQFGRILRQLAIGYIAARSPQAKGRIERLWETLQDRLVAELRLRRVRTLDAAEAYLPTYIAAHNARFARPPAQPRTAWRRPPADLADQLACHYTRQVAPDNTVRLGARLVQIPPGPHRRSYARCRVDLHECLDGRLLVSYQGRRLVTAPPPPGAFVLVPRRERRPPGPRTRSADGGRHLPLARPRDSELRTALADLAAVLRPARAHPWRRSFSVRQRHIPAPLTP
jgi:transposase